MLSGISPPFGRLFRTQGQVTHVLLTRSPLYRGYCYPFLVRLACVRHAASVRSEPGSNSPIKISRLMRRRGIPGLPDLMLLQGLRITWDVRTTYLVFKERRCFRGIAMISKASLDVNTFLSADFLSLISSRSVLYDKSSLGSGPSTPTFFFSTTLVCRGRESTDGRRWKEAKLWRKPPKSVAISLREPEWKWCTWTSNDKGAGGS